jgi:hypothetical protein
MLGADFLYASGLVVETTPEHPDGRRHRFWAYRTMWRVERSDGVTFIDAASESVTIVNGRTGRRGPRHIAGLHLPDRMLRPKYADIWGRSSDDWRLTGAVDGSDTDPGCVAVEISRSDEQAERGIAVVELSSGRIRRLTRPELTWEMVELTEESDGDPALLFDI